ncbi:DHA2 family efflux MFS transporter permease subunit [Erythrobacter donghaensis]|uniref:DHA2 family efflux MFS transporter permease subunit n=1 Tax=Erythrobacter donghaensis TaxID=267135 RepID=UPI000A36C66C|nr:DHA2 family efflux MFS transporter permease subunit [Erythrobacter donghaensis]
MNTTETPEATLRTWAGFLFMCIGMFMAILDIQIVATSLPTIQNALAIDTDQMIWIQTAYLTAEIVAIPLTGFLTAKLGMRWLFVSAVTVFTIASIGCSESQTFTSLIIWRIIQGFAGGTLIPAVFSAVFLLFPVRSQGIATTIAGVAAVFAPTVGPIVGGWITETYSWHWLFRINILPGILAAVGAAVTLRSAASNTRFARSVDMAALALLAVGLTALQIGLKDAPTDGWLSPGVAALLAGFALCAAWFVWRTVRASEPLVELRCFRDRNFAIGCALSFILGMGLFGSTYLMPFFLGLVREHDALRIGEIMLVTGIAQLITAPVAVYLEQRVGARTLTVFGFVLFAVGLLMSTTQTAQTDYAEMFWPQVVRGVATMFCLLPPTRMALGRLSPELVADGSGLFNLMRNLGGAIGLALIDTTIFSRAATYGAKIVDELVAGNIETAVRIGIPRDAFIEQIGTPPDEFTEELIRPLVERQALVDAVNDAWMLIGVLTAFAVVLVFFVRRVPLDKPDESAAEGSSSS